MQTLTTSQRYRFSQNRHFSTITPFFNDNAKVLAEVDASAGQTVTLNYSAPREYETLIAACVDSKGHHFIKPFSLNTKSVSFSTTAANTRALTRAEAGIDISHLTLDKESVKLSLNAGRTIYSYMAENTGDPYMNKAPTDINLWKGSNWENERLWQLSTSSTIGGGWNVVEGTVVRNINAMTPDEESILNAIYAKFLVHKTGGKRVDNLAKIRNSSAVKLFNSHLTSDGQPFTIIPIQMASSDLPNCRLVSPRSSSVTSWLQVLFLRFQVSSVLAPVVLFTAPLLPTLL